MSENGRLSCIVTSADTTSNYNELSSVSVPAASGLMQLLPGHAEAFVEVSGGDLVLKHADGHLETIRLGECECHIKADQVLIIN